MWHLNTQKYKNLFSKMGLVLICGSQVNNMINILSNFNQGILLQDCQLTLQENAAANCNYK